MPLFKGWAKSISRQTLANRVCDRDDVHSSIFMSFPIGSVRVSNESLSHSSICILWNCNHTIALVSFVNAGSKNGCHGTNCSAIPFTVQGPPKRICCLESFEAQRIRRYLLGISEIWIGPYAFHNPSKMFLMISKDGDFLNNLSYITNWKSTFGLSNEYLRQYEQYLRQMPSNEPGSLRRSGMGSLDDDE